LHDPEIVFLDEPTAGVSSAARARFWDLIKRLAKQGKTIFVTSHYMDEVEQCDRIALMRAGRLIALDNPQGLERSTFPEPIYQLSPKTPLPLSEVERLKRIELLDSFEPHGLRFHASARSRAAWSKFLAQEGERFEIREIRPTLEDVFIKLVEGKSR
jgi:ABC-2 type transport system ATP-binding protein